MVVFLTADTLECTLRVCVPSSGLSPLQPSLLIITSTQFFFRFYYCI